MDEKIVEISLRWPPFDPSTVRASELPLATEFFRLNDTTPCNVIIGQESGFHIKRTVIKAKSEHVDCRE